MTERSGTEWRHDASKERGGADWCGACEERGEEIWVDGENGGGEKNGGAALTVMSAAENDDGK